MKNPEIREKTQKILINVEDKSIFITSLQELLRSLKDEKTTKNFKRLVLDTGKFYGVPKPALWVIAGEIGKFIQKNPTKALELLTVLWGEGSYEARQIAGKSVEKFGSKHPKITLDFVYSALPDINNWSLCDSFSIYAVEPVLFTNPEMVLKLSERCINSDNTMIRRFGVINLRGYRKLKITDRVFAIFDKVMEDEEKDVKKAVSFIFRMITPNNHDEVLCYMTQWASLETSKDTKWIIKDGMKKLSKEEQADLLALIS